MQLINIFILPVVLWMTIFTYTCMICICRDCKFCYFKNKCHTFYVMLLVLSIRILKIIAKFRWRQKLKTLLAHANQHLTRDTHAQAVSLAAPN
ncbi:hypothetical protein EB796_009208 [Bugula neritina]|uniref:Uncharacterized protein n=1 Tax=Bugula neritina TaxID=10212 RepID=A0A7J7K1H8_BUGNE|nr:hypothetical protein EB796_009208 [Bugula neritina]